jgi:hypothetical protein
VNCADRGPPTAYSALCPPKRPLPSTFVVDAPGHNFGESRTHCAARTPPEAILDCIAIRGFRTLLHSHGPAECVHEIELSLDIEISRTLPDIHVKAAGN